MPKPAKKPKAKPVKTKSKSSRLWLKYVLAAVLVLGVAAAGSYIVYTVWRQHREAGQFNISDVYPGENLAHSLDLQLAAKAKYPSAPLTTTQDLGIIDGLREQVVSFSVKTDGLTEYALAVLPPGPKPAKGYPAIILLHGYANPERYQTYSFYLSDMEAYAKAGFLVIKPDYRGQGLSLGEGTPDSAYYSMAYNTDVMSLISALKQTAYVDKSNLNLWGHSLGAYLALRAGVLSRDIKNIILLSGPLDSLKQMYLTYIPPSDENNSYALATRTDVFAKYGTPAEDARFWYDASPINYVSKLTAHIQIYVGQADQTVPPRFSADLDAALTKAQIKHDYFSYPDGEHSLLAQRPDIYSHSLKLLEAKSGS